MSEKVYTVAQVKQAEQQCVNNGITEEQLIDRASSCIAEFLRKEDDIVFLCGGGNNGSDGLATALKLKNKKVTVFYGGKPNAINEKLLEKVKQCCETHPLYKYNGEGKVIVDCLLGTGLNRPLSSDFAQAVRIANYAKGKKIAVDIPSGLDDTGMCLSETFIADITLCMGAIKTSTVLCDALDYAGSLVLCDIGLDLQNPIEIVSASDIKIEKRKRNTHKGNYGKIKVIGGSAKFVGAPYFSALACYKSGAGLVTMVVPQSQRIVYSQNAFDGITLDFLPDLDGNFIFDKEQANALMQNTDVIVVGMGMGDSIETKKYIEYFISSFAGTLVIDADGLNALSKNIDILKSERKCKIILTPHIGEARRLNKFYLGKVEQAQEFALENKVTIVIKSATSIITNGKQTAINLTGTPAMSKGGSGDILSGVIGAFASIYDEYTALLYACYYTGLAGEVAEKQNGNQLTLSPQDIISALPLVYSN